MVIYERTTSLEIKLLLLKNKPYKDDLDDKKQISVLWKLRQAMVHSYYSTNKNIFTIIDANGEISDTEYEKNNKKWFVLSKKVLPLIFLNEENYKNTFETQLKLISVSKIVKSIVVSQSEKKIYQECRKYLFRKKTKNNFIQILSQLAFYRALQSAKILRYYLIKQLDSQKGKIKENVFQISAVKKEETIRKYQENIVSIFDELLKKPPIFHLVYFTLTSSDLISSAITNININDEKERLFNLWDFTEELVYGINELAKNIIQHSTKHQGVITGYINKDELNLNVFDYGKEGVLNTLQESTQNTFKTLSLNSILKKHFKEDLDKIKSNEFKYENLFKANNENLLNQQTKRATAHLGLLIFTKLISDNSGKLYTHSYNAKNDEIDEYSNYKSDKIPLPLGTNYEFLLPLKFEGGNKSKYYQKRSSPTSRGIKDKISIEKLMKYQVIKLPNEINFIPKTLKNNYIINIFLKDNSFSFRKFEDEVWKDVHQYLKITAISDIKDGNSIFCLNFEKVQRIDASQLFRFLGKWEIEYPTINLVLYNIHTQLYFDLLRINGLLITQAKELPYWNSDAITLIYSFEELETKKRFYFTDALWGQKRNDFNYINSLIRKTNYNALHFRRQSKKDKKYKTSLIDNNMFYDNLALLPFDLLISDETNTSLFEYNSKALLCNELKNEIENKDELEKEKDIPDSTYVKNKIESLPGFKIPNSHFKLGSKIHISDFYYAKRFFQNSFFASRFAFILAKYIFDKHLNNTDVSKNIKELTIIGYGLYSELLLSLVVSFIIKHFENEEESININHNLYNDTEELKLIKGYVKINKNIIILVPIATTFSTSMKIEEDIQKGENVQNILEHINALVVSNGRMEDKSILLEDDIEFNYGWKIVSNHNKTVNVESYFNHNQIRKQKYFLSLPSIWYPVKDCDICFPNNIDNHCISKVCKTCDDKDIKNKCPLSEKILLGTDKTSVTPSLIFEFPNAREISEEENNFFILTNNALEYGHTIRNNNHFHYHIYDEVFYKENEKSIKSWIYYIVKYQLEKNSSINYSDTDNILIIAPKHFSNTIFINVINEILFANSANILHYDFWKNNIENFKIFYQDVVLESDKIIFIDDTIISGSTYFRSNDFIKHTRNNNYGFDACIFLINRMNSFTQVKIRQELDNGERLFSFANIHLPALKDNGTECQLCKEKERTEKLFEESFLDRFKDSFYKRIEKLTPKEISFNFSDREQERRPFENDKQNLIKVEAIQRVYEYFLQENNKEFFINNDNFGDWHNDLLNKTNSPFKNEFMKGKFNNETISINTAILLKILAFPPFNIYKPIKEKAFKWTNILLNEQIEKIKKRNYTNLEYLDFRDLKFLIRRAGLINSNYLISERFFNFIIELYQKGSLKRLKNIEVINLKNLNKRDKDIFSEPSHTKKESEEIIGSIDTFATYIVSQIKELIYENEARSILLEERINKLLPKTKNDKDLKQLFRLLQEENSILIYRFVKFLNFQLNYQRKTEDTFETILDDLKEQNHYQYTTLCDFFEAAKEEAPIKNEKFKKYLEIQYFLSHPKKEDNSSLEDKTHLLGRMLKELVFGRETEEQGAFLLIKYKTKDKKTNDNLKNIFLAYNSGYGQSYIESNWNNKNTYITSFINGKKNTNGKFIITIEELKRVNKGWTSLYATPDDPIDIDFLTQIEDVSYMLLLRFSINEIVDSEQKKEPQGVMVFYSKCKDFSITQSRYLLLLKQSISKFIEKHHKSAEFNDWVVQKDKLKNSENEKDRYKKAFHNFNHDIVSRVIDQWKELENNTTFSEMFYSYAYKIGANIINSHFYASLSYDGKIHTLFDDFISGWANQIFSDHYKESLKLMMKQDLRIELKFNLCTENKIKIEMYALRAFIILLLQNIKKHKEETRCTAVTISMTETKLEIINKYDKKYKNDIIEKFYDKKKLIKDYRIGKLEGTTLVTINKYCEIHNLTFDFDLDNIKKQFSVSITNKE